MKFYDIYFRFRGTEVKGHVHKYEDSFIVYVQDKDILRDFTGAFYYSVTDKEWKHFTRNKEAKDALDLTRAMAAQLK